MKKKNELHKYIFEYDMVFISILSVVLLIIPILILMALPISFSFELDFDNPATLFIGYVFLFLLVFIWMIIHELIHGISYRINGASKDCVTYGVALEKGIFFCKCSEFISRKNILISVIAPFVLIGVITLIIGILLDSLILVVLSVFNISGAAGDVTIFAFFLQRDKDVRFKELGDSTTFCLETKEDLSDKKFIGVKLKKEVEDEKEIDEPKSKKINISKSSKYIFVGVVVFILIMIFFGLYLSS